MSESYLFDKITELKQKFKDFFQHRKMFKSLENYAEVAPIPMRQRNMLFMVKECLNDGFLDEPEVNFLLHQLDKHGLNYLEWSHRTKWLKGKMAQIARDSRSKEDQMFFDYDKQRSAGTVPFESMLEQVQQNSRRVQC